MREKEREMPKPMLAIKSEFSNVREQSSIDAKKLLLSNDYFRAQKVLH